MNEKQFMTDLWDVLNANTQYITLEEFRKKYIDLFLDCGNEENTIRLGDYHNEWRLLLQKTWCDETQLNKD